MTLVELSTPTVRSTPIDGLPVAVIGSGPIGLATAAHLVERDLDFVVLEAGPRIASSMRSWGHIRLFSPWRHLIDPAARRLLETAGWRAPLDLDTAPTGAELVENYLEPLAALPQIASRVRTASTVQAVTRRGMDRTRSANRAATPFVLRVDGSELAARAVIDASGTYRSPNSLGSNGLDPLGLESVADHVTPGLPDVLGADRARFAGKHVTVVGAGHSAANTLIALGTLIDAVPSTSVTWAIRNARAVRVFTSEDDELSQRASLGSRVQQLVDSGAIELVDGFEIVELSADGGRVDIAGMRGGGIQHITTDVIVNATGFRPDLAMLREVRLDLDDIVEAPSRLAPLIDPNVHTCGTVEPHGFTELQHPEPDFFVVGMKSYGRAPTFLLATGYEQVRSVVAHLDRDVVAARAVELELPATGVCSTTTSCCS